MIKIMNILNRKNRVIFLLVIALILVGSETPVTAQETASVSLRTITYPVADLGSCTSYEDCKTYCGAANNYSKCTAFAQKIGLTIEIPDDKKGVFAAIQKGESPGQCKDEVSCRNYCGDTDNIGECADFADKFDLVTQDELKEMRQIADAKKAGVSFPGNCKTKESCLKYCDNSANAVVCMEFAQKAGFIPKEDVEAVGKILPYLKSGGKLPGGCTTKKSCDTYCGSDANTIECVDFAVNAGFMSKEDADLVKKTGGKSPGNCRSREACDSYCKSDANINECVDFAVKAGFISREDAEMAKKYKITSGPGNCKSKADCEAYCVLPENQETCFNFAKDHGMLSKEDLKNIEEREKFLKSIDKATPEWLACMEKELGPSFFGRFKAGKLTQPEAKSPALETAQRKCGEDTRKKIDACFALSCSEFDACMKSVSESGDDKSGQQQAQGTPDPRIKAKAEACQREKINACLPKPCGAFQACVNALGAGGGGGGTPDPAVVAKFKSCQPPPKQKGSSSGGGGGDQGAMECAKQGGSWVDGRRCDFSKQGAGFQTGECARQGGVWIGTQCVFPKGDSIPQGYPSWQAFCTANYGDSRCGSSRQQQYPLLIDHSFLGAILRYLLK